MSYVLFSLNGKIVIICKYRKKLLVGQLNTDIKRIFQPITDGPDFEIEVFEGDIDHIHFPIRYIPRLSIAQIVCRSKQESTRQIWLLHPSTLCKQYWYRHPL